MHRSTASPSDDASGAFEDGWTLRIADTAADREEWIGTVMALANGALGVRGVRDEQPHGAATFLAAAYETTPIHYHERHKGFAGTTDTRIPVADAATIAITVDGAPIAAAGDTPVTCERILDLRSGRLFRRTIWPSSAGPIAVDVERDLPVDGGAAAVMTYRIAPITGSAMIDVASGLRAPARAVEQGRDPRIGVADPAGLMTIAVDARAQTLVQRTRRSAITVAVACEHRPAGDAITAFDDGFARHFRAIASPASPLTLAKTVAYATHPPAGEPLDDARRLATIAWREAEAAVDARSAALAIFWDNAEISIDGDAEASRALRFNMFQVFQSAPRDGRLGLAAKGLTGEGYEGHSFWDGEVFALPMLAVTAPKLARAMLDYRYATLDAARANARALDHPSGALFAWRTIAGREASAHYPSGSAQYHINADVAFAIGLYDAATGDTDFLIEKGGEMLAETARIWMEIGDFAGDEFRILGVTGPDEYTVLIDNNWYTNRMAQAHLRLAADIADRLAREAPESWKATRQRIALSDEEIARWRRAAEAMRLPFDAERDLDAQDDSFLGKPEWDIAGTPADHFPLLLHYHPMSLYRRQVAKQADLVLAMVLAGEGISLDRKRRAFDHYSRVTVHDSTLSDCSFSILASEVGRADAAMRHFRAAAFVDLHDLHGNSHHGAHMAAMGGSWQALVWGFGGFRPHGAIPGFAPVLPREWGGYSFTMLWRGTRFRVEIGPDTVIYRHLAGPPLAARHHREAFTLIGGERRFGRGA